MAVQVPQLKRLPSAEPLSVGRLDVQAPDLTLGSQQVKKEQEGVVSSFDKYLEQEEENAAENEAIRRDNIYADTFGKEFYGDSKTGKIGITEMEGDPTDLYNKFDEKMKSVKDELLKTEGLSDKTRAKIEARILNRERSLNTQRLVAYGNQYSKYDDQVKNAGIDLEKKTATDAMIYVQDGDPTSIIPFQQSIMKIQDIHIKRAMRRGDIQPSPEGQFKFVDSDGVEKRVNLGLTTKASIRKDIGDTVYEGSKLLIQTNRFASAKAMVDQYKSYLDPVHQAKLAEDFEKANIEYNAYNILTSTEDKPVAEQRRIIKQEKDPKIRQEALKLLDENERIKENLKKRDSTDMYNELAVAINNRMSSKDPVTGAFSNRFELDKSVLTLSNGSTVRFSDAVQRVTDAAQLKALYAFVDSPDESDPEAKSKAMEMLRDGQFYGLPYPDLSQAMVGLNKEDRKMVESDWRKQNTETEPAERARANAVNTQIYEQYLPLIKRDDRGRETKRSLERRVDFQTRMKLKFDKLPKNLTPSELAEMIREEVAQETIKQKKENSGWYQRFSEAAGWAQPLPEPKEVNPPRAKNQPRKPFGGVSTAPVAPVAPAEKLKNVRKPFSEMSTSEQEAAMIEFQAVHKRGPKSRDEFKQWWNSK